MHEHELVVSLHDIKCHFESSEFGDANDVYHGGHWKKVKLMPAGEEVGAAGRSEKRRERSIYHIGKDRRDTYIWISYLRQTRDLKEARMEWGCACQKQCKALCFNTDTEYVNSIFGMTERCNCTKSEQRLCWPSKPYKSLDISAGISNHAAVAPMDLLTREKFSILATAQGEIIYMCPTDEKCRPNGETTAIALVQAGSQNSCAGCLSASYGAGEESGRGSVDLAACSDGGQGRIATVTALKFSKTLPYYLAVGYSTSLLEIWVPLKIVEGRALSDENSENLPRPVISRRLVMRESGITCLEWHPLRSILVVCLAESPDAITVWQVQACGAQRFLRHLYTVDSVEGCGASVAAWHPFEDRLAVGSMQGLFAVMNLNLVCENSRFPAVRLASERGRVNRAAGAAPVPPGEPCCEELHLEEGGAKVQSSSCGCSKTSSSIGIARSNETGKCGTKNGSSRMQEDQGRWGSAEDKRTVWWDRGEAIKAHQGEIKSVVWSPHKRYIAVTGSHCLEDGRIRVWRVCAETTPVCLHTIHTDSQINSMMWNKFTGELVVAHASTFAESSRAKGHSGLTIWQQLGNLLFYMGSISNDTGESGQPAVLDNAFSLVQTDDGKYIAYHSLPREYILLWKFPAAPAHSRGFDMTARSCMYQLSSGVQRHANHRGLATSDGGAAAGRRFLPNFLSPLASRPCQVLRH